MIYMTDKELFNELSYKRKNVYENLSEQEYKEMFELCDEYREFLDEGKTERECVEKSIKMAELHGFKNINSVKQIRFIRLTETKIFYLRLSAVKILKTV